MSIKKLKPKVSKLVSKPGNKRLPAILTKKDGSIWEVRGVTKKRFKRIK